MINSSSYLIEFFRLYIKTIYPPNYKSCMWCQISIPCFVSFSCFPPFFLFLNCVLTALFLTFNGSYEAHLQMAENIPVGFNLIYISALKGWIVRYSTTQLVPRQNSPRYLHHPTHKNIRRKLKECDYNNFYELQSKNLDFVEMLSV